MMSKGTVSPTDFRIGLEKGELGSKERVVEALALERVS